MHMSIIFIERGCCRFGDTVGLSPGSTQGTGRGHLQIGDKKNKFSRPSSRRWRRNYYLDSWWYYPWMEGALVVKGEIIVLLPCYMHSANCASPPWGTIIWWCTLINHVPPSTLLYIISNEETPHRLTAPDVNEMPSSLCPFTNHIQGTYTTRIVNTVLAKTVVVHWLWLPNDVSEQHNQLPKRGILLRLLVTINISC